MTGSLARIRCTVPAALRLTPEDPLVWLENDLLDFDAPYDLIPQTPGGGRAVDSALVVHTDDAWPTSYAYIYTGHLYATSPEQLETRYFRFKRLLKYADQAWRGERYLKIRGALMGATEPLRGQCVVPATIACRVIDLRWYDKEGNTLE